jgi:hypothetical protein
MVWSGLKAEVSAGTGVIEEKTNSVPVQSPAPLLIEFSCLTFNMCHRLCMGDYEEVFRRIMGVQKSGPAVEPLGVSHGAAEHLPGGTRAPR